MPATSLHQRRISTPCTDRSRRRQGPSWAPEASRADASLLSGGRAKQAAMQDRGIQPGQDAERPIHPRGTPSTSRTRRTAYFYSTPGFRLFNQALGRPARSLRTDLSTGAGDRCKCPRYTLRPSPQEGPIPLRAGTSMRLRNADDVGHAGCHTNAPHSARLRTANLALLN